MPNTNQTRGLRCNIDFVLTYPENVIREYPRDEDASRAPCEHGDLMVGHVPSVPGTSRVWTFPTRALALSALARLAMHMYSVATRVPPRRPEGPAAQELREASETLRAAADRLAQAADAHRDRAVTE